MYLQKKGKIEREAVCLSSVEALINIIFVVSIVLLILQEPVLLAVVALVGLLRGYKGALIRTGRLIKSLREISISVKWIFYSEKLNSEIKL